MSVLPAAPAEPATLSPEPVILDAGNAHLGENRDVIPPSSVQVWTFQGRNGQLIIVNAIADQPTTGIYGITEQIERGALDTWLAVRAPDGTLLAVNDDFQGDSDRDARVDVILPEDGSYQILVGSVQNRTSGPYTLRIEEIQIAVERSRYTLEEGAGFEAIAVSGDGHQVLGSQTSIVPFFGGKAFDSSVIAWSVGEAGDFRERCRFGTGANEHAQQGEPSLQLSPDEQTVMSGSWDATMILWDLETCQTIGETFRGHRWLVADLAFTPDGTKVLSGSYDGTARLWEVTTHAELQLFDLGLYVSGVDISLDGNMAVLASHNGTVTVVDLATGQEIHRIVDPDTPRKVALSPNGRMVASGNVRGDIILWDSVTGQAIRRLSGHLCEILQCRRSLCSVIFV